MMADAGGPTGRAHGADALAEHNRLAGLDRNGVRMGEGRLETAPMIYLDSISIP